MVQLIVGKKGKGKTKHLLDKVNSAVKTASGNIVYLDKNSKNMYELNNKIRLINVSDYLVSDCDEFLGFICGIISQDHDLEQMYLDSFLVNAHLEGQDIAPAIEKLEKISSAFNVEFTINVSLDEAELPESLKEKIIVSL
ncbi:MAG: twitching motility protein PilT [Lachnospiraceae bacterium]|nr:twitching motility protein PilT [Lachnospiraceae bacterium]